ncbi:unnamed protein product [Calypogeia fissa]
MEIHHAIQEHERAALASQHDEEPGQFLMKLLGIEEWFSIYLLAQKGGIQMALQRLREYQGILEYMEGDDACELAKANASIVLMTAALTKVALDTYHAFHDTNNPSCNTSGHRLVTGSLGASSSTAVPPVLSQSAVDLITHISLASPEVVPSSFLEGILVSPLGGILFSTPNSTPESVNGASPSTPADVYSSIKDNPLLDLEWLTEDELIDMNVDLSTVNVAPLPTISIEIEATGTGTGEPFVPLLTPRFIEWECSKEDG